MGRRGPRPTPTPILQMRGSALATRAREQAEVKGPAGTPECPDGLDDDAKAAWDQLVPMLERMRVLTRIDGNALTRYCRLWSRWRAAEQFIKDRGEMYPIKDDAGKVKWFQQWPQVAIANKLAQQLTRLEQEFGMTPSARSRIQLMQDATPFESSKARFFTRTG